MFTRRGPATGKRRQKTKSGFRTKAAAETALRDFIGRVETGGYTAESNLTVAEYLDQWLATVQADLRPTTIASYRRDVATMLTVRIARTVCNSTTPA